MELNKKIKEELRSTLWNFSSTTDLDSIATKLNLEEQFKPVLEKARRSQGDVSQLLSHFPRIQESRTRIKTLDSTLFKMIYCRKSDLNRINDIIGFMAIVNEPSDCYKLLSELIEEGLRPSVRMYDSLDGTVSDYRSLDANFIFHDHYFQVQIRTVEMQRIYDQGPLTSEAYKERHFKKLHQYLSDQNFGIDYRLALFEMVVNNFKEGHSKMGIDQLGGFTATLDKYSANPMDYTQLYEIKLTDNTKQIILNE